MLNVWDPNSRKQLVELLGYKYVFSFEKGKNGPEGSSEMSRAAKRSSETDWIMVATTGPLSTAPGVGLLPPWFQSVGPLPLRAKKVGL